MKTYFNFILTAFLFISLVKTTFAQMNYDQNRLFKVVLFAESTAALEQSAFIEQTKIKAVPDLKEIPNLKGQIFNFTAPGTENSDYDVIVEMWFDSEDAYQAAMGSSKGKSAMANFKTLLRDEISTIAFFESKIIYPPVVEEGGAYDGYKRVYLANHNPEHTLKECHYRHLRDYAPVGTTLPKSKGYTINYAIEEDAGYPADILVCSWAESSEILDEAFKNWEGRSIVLNMTPDLFGESLRYWQVI